MPTMHVTTTTGRTLEEKKALVLALTDCIENALKRPREIIRVVFHEIPGNSYAVAGEMLNGKMDTMVNVLIIEGRTREQKDDLSNQVIAAVQSVPAFTGGPIRAFIHEVEKESFKRTA